MSAMSDVPLHLPRRPEGLACRRGARIANGADVRDLRPVAKASSAL